MSTIIQTVFVCSCIATAGVIGGDIDPPPGPVAPTMLRLDQIESRTIVQSLAGSATATHVIDAPGSYFLTGPILGVAGKNGIEIISDGVSLDLNGFALVGAPGSLDGVRVEPAGFDEHDTPIPRIDITVHNGSARNWDGDGFNLKNASTGAAHDLHASNNGVDGFHIGSGFTIKSCVAQENLDDGFELSPRSIVSSCIASGSGDDGFDLGSGSVITNCSARGVDDDGFVMGEASRLSHCTATGNGGDGIQVGRLNFISDNMCDGNGLSGVGAAIHVLSSGNRIENNLVSVSKTGIKTELGSSLIIGNMARSNVVNYDLAPGNTVGPIVSASDPIVSQNPWANFLP